VAIRKSVAAVLVDFQRMFTPQEKAAGAAAGAGIGVLVGGGVPGALLGGLIGMLAPSIFDRACVERVMNPKGLPLSQAYSLLESSIWCALAVSMGRRNTISKSTCRAQQLKLCRSVASSG
jgi:hypothetical protein